MKMIIAIIRPEKLEDVQDALDAKRSPPDDRLGRPRLRTPARLHRKLPRQQGRHPPALQGETRDRRQREFVKPTVEAILKAAAPSRANRRRQNLRPAAGRMLSHSHRRKRHRGHRAMSPSSPDAVRLVQGPVWSHLPRRSLVQTTQSPAIFDVAQLPDASHRRKVNVLVVSSVALAFMSFWRAAAIVLCDLASTAYYIGGISEQAVGKAAPWFILAVMLFVYPVTAVYMESCTLFTRGGVYKVVKGAVGGGLAKLSVSALMFDYILTGPISSVAAGQYLVGLFGDMLKLATEHATHPIIFDATTHPDTINFLTMLIAIGITLYFWRTNIIGIHESSEQGAAHHAANHRNGPAHLSLERDHPLDHAARNDPCSADSSNIYPDQP